MYKFKVGDTVRPKNVPNPQDYVIQEITNTGWHRRHVDDKVYSYQAESLELVCPAGYRPVRGDEMDQSPAKGDAYIYGGILTVLDSNSSIPFWRHSQITFYRPVEQKLEWGWTDGDGNGAFELTEEDAKAGAKTFSENYDKKTFVYKVVGKFTVKTETKVEWNDS